MHTVTVSKYKILNKQHTHTHKHIHIQDTCKSNETQTVQWCDEGRINQKTLYQGKHFVFFKETDKNKN